ncbi:MaoC/PaaZ C-terminal domain-containing protein [Nocardia mangyaensis]|uniref:MaoC/PaaZ C-terminal domain-containing protein n=1 Tax=Nocardia mangyaensis TaxID=2213200 RepID=UPI000A02C0A7|nr:MaoC/PaaZ C-terminal domain-containing protein [Nocardia mangyaensis]
MRTFHGIDELADAVGTRLGYSEWHTVAQAQIDTFADATGDHQWIHIDPAKATHGPWLAQAFCRALAVYAGEEAEPLHGGMGMTWEHPAHLYLERAKADQLAFGTASAHRARLAGLVEDSGS